MKKKPSYFLSLKRGGYQLDDNCGVWRHLADEEKFSYSDGVDTEKRLLEIVREVADVSADSQELNHRITDWPSEYHFGQRRANLLRPITSGLQGKVLEIGAGCGAISRFAGECGADVLALEGSLARASVAASRCRDLSNVTVVCDRFDKFLTNETFDTVLLIGVLEYSKIFAPIDVGDPIQWMLEKARSLLSPTGILVVAIENQLGLKYFAGCGEDHIGTPFYGVEGLYKSNEAMTFGRRELSNRLSKAGLPSQRLLLPFPDYKIPDVVLDESACSTVDFNAASLIGFCVSRDYSGPVAKTFTEPLVWPAVSKNGILTDLSNSFLFIAATDDVALNSNLVDRSTLAWSYSSDRAAPFATNTTIAKSNGSLIVSKTYRHQAPTQTKSSQNENWFHLIESTGEYFNGERLDTILLRVLAAGDTDTFLMLSLRWLDMLLEQSQAEDGLDQTLVSTWKCNGRFIDLIPRNIVLDVHDKLKIFDQEWGSYNPIPLSWIVIRGVLSFAPLAINGTWVRSQSVISLVHSILAKRNLKLCDADVALARKIDAEFLAWVRNQDIEKTTWPIEFVTNPISSFGESMVELAKRAASPSDASRAQLLEIETQLDAERIAHAKLIGAYEHAERSNQSLIRELAKAQSFAAEVLAQKAAVEQQISTIEQKLLDTEVAAASAKEANEAILFKEADSLRHQLDNERIAHAKLIGAYERAEASNQSLILELAKAQDFAMEVQAHRGAAEQKIPILETELTELRAETAAAFAAEKDTLFQEAQNLRIQLDGERIAHAKLIGSYQQSEKNNLTLGTELNKARTHAAELLDLKNKIEAQVVETQAQFAALQADYKEALSQIGDLENYRDSLQNALNQSLHNAGSLEQRIKLEETARRELEAILDQTQLELNQRIQQISELAQTSQALQAQLDSTMTLLNLAREASAASLDKLTRENTELRAAITQLELQQSAMNAEVLRLNIERATFGARVGRKITGLRGKVAPLTSRRGRATTLAVRFANKVISAGWGAAIAQVRQYLIFRQRVRQAHKDVQNNASLDVADYSGAAREIQPTRRNNADHPQLAAWMDLCEPDDEQLLAQTAEARNFAYSPMVSAIVPIYRVPRDVLDETLSSLEQQTYANWQACLVWADTEDPDGWSWLQERTRSDSRFSIKQLAQNDGISGNSNAALEMAKGEFIALLDHDDTLTPWAFFDVIKLLQTSPHLDFIYSDKDSLTADGLVRLNALFKPEWSPEMLHSVNYLTHLNVFRTSLIHDIGGWRKETDGAQDWDLFFRLTERTNNIARIPSIHYHWRILPTSTATGLQAKPYAAQGQLRAQQDHFRRRGIPATVVPSPEGMFHVCWSPKEAFLDVVIFQHGSVRELVNVLDVIRAGKQETIRRIHVVHRSPLDESLSAFISVWPNMVQFTQSDSPNWRTALEIAVSDFHATTVLLIDGTATGLSETITEELSGWTSQHPDIAWTSAVALGRDNTVYEAGRVVGKGGQTAPLFSGNPLYSYGWFGGPLWYRNARACSPYAVAMRADAIRNALPNIDRHEGSRAEFTELCMALVAQGKRGLINPFARVHFDAPPESEWPNEGNLYNADPYFNPSFEQVSPLQLRS